jgi:hypothetical protein
MDALLPATWVVDSGATQHITNDMSDFVEVAELPAGQRTIRCAGSQLLVVRAVGTVRLHFVSDAGPTTLVLRDVAYVPDAAEKLLAPNRLLAEGVGWAVDHVTQACTATSGGVVLFRAPLCGGLHRLTPAPAVAFLASSSEETAQLWHRRFGHLSYHSLAPTSRAFMCRLLPLSNRLLLTVRPVCRRGGTAAPIRHLAIEPVVCLCGCTWTRVARCLLRVAVYGTVPRS